MAAHSVRARLVNEPFGDPGVVVDFAFERRALLFDLGDLSVLPPRALLRVSDVFVTHTHMDHFCGFDRWLRIALGREATVRLHGPPGFVDSVERKLSAYTWNLVHNYEGNLVIHAAELHPDGARRGARFECRRAFAREDLALPALGPGLAWAEEGFRVRACFLDHDVPCLGYAFEEAIRVNLRRSRLLDLGIPAGPWVGELKRAILRGAPDDHRVRVTWSEAGVAHERALDLGVLRGEVALVGPGERIAYVTDIAGTEANARAVAELARGADLLFIEAVFLDRDAAHAARKLHLTARQAGEIARRAGARAAEPFHFSPRYREEEAALREEFVGAWRGEAPGTRAAPQRPREP